MQEKNQWWVSGRRKANLTDKDVQRTLFAASGSQDLMAEGPGRAKLYGMIAGAVGGAVLGKIGRDKAAGEYDENLKKRNIAEDEIIRARREDDYYMASGRESMGALKNLRKT